ncbi:serine/threonine-protein kinase [Mangrovitalea sediminis]|uniref:serine/threonine-protein kinase n=1 Tax=Mangrovitalea sediminis TaxID=1982043 RepID=UPI000BE552C1|nr:serine/threonine-protein kinase [Mangrovitalea sediminis]
MAVETPKQAPTTGAIQTPRHDNDDIPESVNTRRSDSVKTRSRERERPQTSTKSQPNTASTSRRPALQPGAVLSNRYEILALLGSGGTSRVFKARDRHLEQAGEHACEVALKVLNESYADDDDAVRMLQQEVYKSRLLCHPNLVRIYDCDKSDGLFFVVMELLDGETLDAVIKRARPRGLSPKAAISILRDLCSALEVAHGAGLIHADLKPSNIMVTHDGQVKLLDFGVARRVHSPLLPGMESKGDADEVLGLTPAYASCALLEGKEPTPSDDVFALACIGYEMLTTQHPFSRKPANEARLAGLLPKRCNGLSRAQWRTLHRALAFDREAGFQTVSTFMKALAGHRYGKRYAVAAVVLAAIAASTGWGYLQHRQLTSLASQDNAHRALVEKLTAAFAQAPQNDSQWISSDAVQQLSAVEKAGLLRLQRNAFVNNLKQEVAKGLSKPDGQYVDFVGLQSLLTQARKLYPDSQALTETQRDLDQRRSGLLSALTFQANGLLEQQRYGHAKGDDDDLYKIASRLKAIRPGYSVTTSDRAVAAYKTSVAKAIDAWDPSSLRKLLDIGRLYFPQLPTYLKLLQRGDGFIAATHAMAAYEQEVATNSKATLPQKAAQTFYGGYLAHLSTVLETADDEQSLNEVEMGLRRVANQLPATFKPLLDTRRKLANAYIRDANQLLEKGQYQRGKALISKANRILSMLGS